MKRYLVFLFLSFFLCCSGCEGFANRNISISRKVLIVYDSRYGATQLTSKWIAEGIGDNVKVLHVESVKESDFKDVDFLLIGTPIFRGEIVTPDIAKFVKEKKEKLANIPIGLYVVCGTHLVWGNEYLTNFENLIRTHIRQAKIKVKKAFGGRILPEDLDDEDREKMDDYWKSRGLNAIKKEDFLDKKACIEFGREVKKMILEGKI